MGKVSHSMGFCCPGRSLTALLRLFGSRGRICSFDTAQDPGSHVDGANGRWCMVSSGVDLGNLGAGTYG